MPDLRDARCRGTIGGKKKQRLEKQQKHEGGTPSGREGNPDVHRDSPRENVRENTSFMFPVHTADRKNR